MDVRRRIPHTDLDVFPLGLGGNVFGSTVTDEASAAAVLDAFVDAGGNLIDTADSYCAFMGTAGGESETMLGEWMKRRRNRDRVVIATKVGQLPGRDNLRPDTIRAAVEDALRRLQTDVIDIFYTHQDHGDPLDETVAELDAIVREGKARYVAASNISGPRLQEALAISRQRGWASYVALQPQYNLMDRLPYERELAPVVAEHGLGVFPWWGLASGYLTGKYRLGRPLPAGARLPYVEPYVSERGEQVLEVLREVADGHGVTPAAMALAWLASRPGVVSPLASARTVGQLQELVQMAGVRLTDDVVVALDAVSAPLTEPVA
jgi:aryl-alcohol dehydrogenase-like predicted oxidoreductase